jgi:hypothetical protein
MSLFLTKAATWETGGEGPTGPTGPTGASVTGPTGPSVTGPTGPKHRPGVPKQQQPK